LVYVAYADVIEDYSNYSGHVGLCDF